MTPRVTNCLLITNIEVKANFWPYVQWKACISIANIVHAGEKQLYIFLLPDHGPLTAALSHSATYQTFRTTVPIISAAGLAA